jgi:hypothetical protein
VFCAKESAPQRLEIDCGLATAPCSRRATVYSNCVSDVQENTGAKRHFILLPNAFVNLRVAFVCQCP